STQRAEELLQGEAFFNVVPSAAGELSVSTDVGQILTNDSEFCVSCDSTTTMLTVSRHTVRVVTSSQQTDLGEGLSLRFSAHQTGAIQHAELD
ncbi:FecR domain-containing protein, partial [Pseudomonas viridiflava]|uniref:FecR domain-containing protein n=1 Tax=Pseudomonas viridiflava TaxID=33069 RepID=UPI0019D06DAF